MSDKNRRVLKEAMNLAYQHPELPVSIYVNSEDLVDDVQYTSHKFSRVSIELWFVQEESIYTDEDAIHEMIYDRVHDAAAAGYYDDGAHAEERSEAFDEIYEAEVSERIVIYTEPD